MIEFEVSEDSSSGVLKPIGDLSLEQALELKTLLKNALKSVNHLIVDFQETTGISLSCLQLLCAAHEMARAENKSIILMDSRPDFINRFMMQTGLGREKDEVIAGYMEFGA